MNKLLETLVLLISTVSMVQASSTAKNQQEKGSGTGSSAGGAALWCVASQTASKKALQDALDWVCGQGGADCLAIQKGGACYSPNTLHDHASYAFNDYYHKNPNPSSCVFGGTAITTTIDPSSANCKYPSSSPSSSSGGFPTAPINPGPPLGVPGNPSPPFTFPSPPISWEENPNSVSSKFGRFSWVLIFACLAYVAHQIA